MSTPSVTSSKHEKSIADLSQELDSLRSLNRTLTTYLEHLRGFKKNLIALNNNYTQLGKVNSQWIDLVKKQR